MSNDEWLKHTLVQIETKVDKLDGRMDDQSILLAKQSTVLEEHQRRSLANEENVDLLRKEFKPIKKHVEAFNFLLKLIGFLATLGTLITAIIKITKF